MNNGLLIDDDEVYARILQRSLQRRGLQVRIAHDAASALALVATEAGARVAEGTGAGGTFAVVCAPEHGFDEFAAAVGACGLVELPV